MNSPMWTAVLGTGLILMSFLDGWRDSLIQRKSNVGWWTYHLVKWASFYPPLVLIGVTFLDRKTWIPVSVGAILAWQAGAAMGGDSYESMWTRMAKTVFGRKDSV